MAKGTSQNTTLALASASAAWGSGVSTDTGLIQFAKVSSLGLTPMRDVVQDESIGTNFPECVQMGRKNQDFTMSTEIRWSGSHFIPLFNYLGFDSSSVSSGKYNHYAMIQGDQDGINFTAEAKVNSTSGNAQYFRWNSVKSQAITISSNDNGFLEMEVTGIANDLEIAGAGTIYTYADAVSETCGRIPFGSGKVWLTTAAAATITSADHVAISGFTLTMSRPLERDFTAKSGTNQQWQTAEPTINGLQSEVAMLTLEFASYDDYDYFTAFSAETDYKLIMQWDDGVTTDIFKIAFPRLKIVEPAYSVDGPGRIPLSLNFQAYRATSTPAGFTAGEIDPVIFTVQNEEDTKNFLSGATIS